MSCFCKKRVTTSGPKVKEIPRSFSAHPVISLSGSLQSRSHKSPQSGIYRIVLTRYIEDGQGWLTAIGRIIRRICSMEFRSGLNPPCIQNIFSSMRAATGMQLNKSMKAFHSITLYRLLHSSQKPFNRFISGHSWFPRKGKKLSGYLIL